MSTHPIKLYGFKLSGHSHRVELMLSLLGLPSEFVLVDLTQGAHKTPEFLASFNRFGQVPVIDDNGTVLADSNAILVYLATQYGNGQWLPADALGQARVQRWLSVAAGQLHVGPPARAWPWCLGRRSISTPPSAAHTPCSQCSSSN
jgi:glutathione S-transferase